jgi:hypothetical protein
MSHPYSLLMITSRDDLMLFTVTSDSTLRLFLPVLDQPHYLQLHAALDLFSTLPLSASSSSLNPFSASVFRLDRKLVKDTFTHISKQENMDKDNASHRRMYEINENGWDLFLRVLEDGTLMVGAVAVSMSLCSQRTQPDHFLRTLIADLLLS